MMAPAIPNPMFFTGRKGRGGTNLMTKATMKRPAAQAVKETRLFINNEWVEPKDGGTFDTFNPATGEVLAKVAAASAADVDRAVKAGRAALESGPWARM